MGNLLVGVAIWHGKVLPNIHSMLLLNKLGGGKVAKVKKSKKAGRRERSSEKNNGHCLFGYFLKFLLLG